MICRFETRILGIYSYYLILSYSLLVLSLLILGSVVLVIVGDQKDKVQPSSRVVNTATSAMSFLFKAMFSLLVASSNNLFSIFLLAA